MSRGEAWLVGAANLLVGGTGLVYAAMRYLLEPSDPYAVVNHPWQPAVQHFHILAAPLLVFAIGLIWHRHVRGGRQSGLAPRRRSGLVLSFALVPMVISGYLIQVTVGESWRTIWVAVHCVASALWVLAYGGHWLISWRQRRLASDATSSVKVAAASVASSVKVRWAVLLLIGLGVWAVGARGMVGGSTASGSSVPHRLASIEGGTQSDGAAVVERRLPMMGTILHLTVEADRHENALAASERAVQVLEAAEDRLSTWRSDSELSRLNRAPVDQMVELSAELAEELAAARRFWVATRGAFDPGIGALVEAWGLRHGGRLPDRVERRRALAASGMVKLELDGRRAVRRHPALVLEEGGFGKGAALDRALAVLAASGIHRAVVDLGGQVAFLGEGDQVACSIADPRQRGRPALLVSVDGGSVATSGNSERGVTVDGIRYGHLLDPRTGEPAPDFGSVTVWAPTATAADCLATGLYVMGPDAALAWAAADREAELVILEPTARGLHARATPGLRGRLSPVSDALAIDYSTGTADGAESH
jgi:thiamine biosynthesis lipoprotein